MIAHDPSAMCIYTCDSPLVCADEWNERNKGERDMHEDNYMSYKKVREAIEALFQPLSLIHISEPTRPY